MPRIDWRDGHDDLDDAWRAARRNARANRAATRGDDRPNLEATYLASLGMSNGR